MATVTLESTVAEAKSPFLAPTPEGRARFTRETYRRMYEAGVFGADAHVELIDGEIMMMSPIGPPQGSLITRLMTFLIRNLPEEIDCRAQLPIVSADHSEPEPDIALVRHQDDDYKSEHPSPSDVILLIEVSDSSLKFDLGRKLQFYSSIGIVEYWVINIAKQLVLIHRDPDGASYKHVETFGVGSTIVPTAVPDCRLDLGWLFR